MVITAHVSRCAAVAVAGFTALSLAGCGSSNPPSKSSSSNPATAASSTTPSASPTPGASGTDKTFGLVGSVSGNTVTLAGSNGPATVGVSPSTRVIELTPGQLADVTAGACVLVRPTKDSGRPPTVTAAMVLVGETVNGRCGGVTGTVVSVNGDSIIVTPADKGQTTVTVTPNTRYAKRNKTDTSAIAAGQCLAARGTKDDSGNLQATAVYLRPSANGRCGS